MEYRARRGVCIGVGQHLAAGDPVPQGLDPATVRYLTNIDAIEAVADEAPPAPPEQVPEIVSTPVKAGRKEK